MHLSTLLLRWSWRDLRTNWVKVLAIAIVIALGTGTYAGLTSSARWRTLSNEASFGLLNVHDIRIELAEGSVVPEGGLAAAVRSIDHFSWVRDVEERRILELLVDAGTEDLDILVPGLMVGADPSASVDALYNDGGRDLTAADAGEDVVLLQHSFARYYELPHEGIITISGGRTLTYVGHAMQPEYFMVAPEDQIFFSEASYAVLFTTLETAQRIAGKPGVNDIVLTVSDGADPSIVADEAVAAIDAMLGVGAEAELISDNTGYRALTEDVANDQQVFNLFAFLLLGGAVAGAFNLVNRLVERQRREIGAAMALGVRPLIIAIRPLLVGAQIALLGVIFGIVVGLLIGAAMRSVFVDLLPLPIWRTHFQTGVFAGAAAFGFLVPFGAAAWPVWRAVRVRPVEAIRPIHLTGGRRSVAKRRIRRLRIPGDTFTRMPFRNLGRARRRTATTLLAVAAVVVVLVGFLGMADSIYETLDVAEREMLQDAPDRVVVDLEGFHAIDSPQVRSILDAPSVGSADPGARVGAAAVVADTAMPLLIEFVDFDTAVWTPTIAEGSAFDRGLILSEKAATDLGVGVGDSVMLRFPVRTGSDTFALRSVQIPIAGLHPYPLRPFAYMDLMEADGFGLRGDVNLLNVLPAPGFDAADVKRDLLDAEAVVAVQPVATVMDSVEEQLGAITGILSILGFAVFVLALLIAFNSASINLDERFRDHATMFAYGVPVRTALRMAMIESLVIGVIATAIGIAGGIGMVWWVTSQLLAETIPDLGISVSLEASTLLLTVVLGVAAVAIAPIFTLRRMRRMDLPGTLRLME